ncbi:helix-turn-helix domain-containing protein [Sanguibacter massiliensis]|uniref:helix-turn-helix domain-containing protein n=1 Tax=Sanguibacter massiliensis TaxID=1973217 RepID=UPI001F5D74B4|nr:helix-turn-helix domain-containing protein [Sanguibacter massiliensis]
MPDPTATAPPVEAIDRALVLLETLASAGPGGLSVAELAATTGLNKTTLHRALAALRHRGFADQDPSSGTYALGAAAVGLGDAFLREDNLPGLLHPALLALSRAAGELVHLACSSARASSISTRLSPSGRCASSPRSAAATPR